MSQQAHLIKKLDYVSRKKFTKLNKGSLRAGVMATYDG